MNFIQDLQRAIDYMEEHILEPITYEDVAKHVYMSSYHFHRTFSLVIGITANEYIRNRRLSMAGQELSMSDTKVIDIALKYGYDTPESFTKAFTRFRGNVPEGYTIWEVKPTLWAVFKCIGETGDCIGETWRKIFSEFLPGSEYSMIDDTDFELYSEDIKSDYFCEIWIPVEKKTYS